MTHFTFYILTFSVVLFWNIFLKPFCTFMTESVSQTLVQFSLLTEVVCVSIPTNGTHMWQMKHQGGLVMSYFISAPLSVDYSLIILPLLSLTLLFLLICAFLWLALFSISTAVFSAASAADSVKDKLQMWRGISLQSGPTPKAIRKVENFKGHKADRYKMMCPFSFLLYMTHIGCLMLVLEMV